MSLREDTFVTNLALYSRILACDLKRGGVLCLRHTERLTGDNETRKAFDAGRLVVLNGGRSGKNLCAAIQPNAYVDNLYAIGVSKCTAPRGWNGQDVWIAGSDDTTTP